MKKTILPLCGALLLSAGLVSCGEKDDPTTTGTTGGKKISLSVWVPSEQVTWAKERIVDFQANYPDKVFDITVTPVQEGDVQTKIKTDPEASADVFFYAGDHIGPLTDAGYLYSYGETVVNHLASTMSANVLASGKVDDKLYGIPYTPNTYFMYYDGSKITADEAKDLDAILAKGKVIFDIDNGWYQTAFWYGTGVRFFGPTGTDATQANLDSTEGYIAAKAIRDYVLNDNFINGGDDEIKAQFTKDNANNIVAVVGGSWLSEGLLTSFGEDLKATVLPTFHQGGNEYHLTATGDWKKCGVSRYTAAPLEAQQLALWLTNKESALTKLELFNEVPVLTELESDPAVTGNKIASAVMAQANSDYIVLQPSIAQMSNWWDAATAYANAIIASKTEGTAFSDDLCVEWAAKLQGDLLKQITA